MISPQMSAWVRVWAWVSEAGDSPFIQVAHRCSEPAAGPADPEGRRAAGWRRGLRTCFGPLRRPSRQRSVVQLGMAASLSQKKPPQQFFKRGGDGKGGVCSAAVPRAVRCQQRQRGGAGGESLQHGERPSARHPRGPPGPAGVIGGVRHRGKFSWLFPVLLRAPLHPRGGRSQQR